MFKKQHLIYVKWTMIFKCRWHVLMADSKKKWTSHLFLYWSSRYLLDYNVYHWVTLWMCILCRHLKYRNLISFRMMFKSGIFIRFAFYNKHNQRNDTIHILIYKKIIENLYYNTVSYFIQSLKNKEIFMLSIRSDKKMLIQKKYQDFP